MRRRELHESLNYLADLLIEACEGLDDKRSAKVGGVAIALQTIAFEIEPAHIDPAEIARIIEGR